MHTMIRQPFIRPPFGGLSELMGLATPRCTPCVAPLRTPLAWGHWRTPTFGRLKLRRAPDPRGQCLETTNPRPFHWETTNPRPFKQTANHSNKPSTIQWGNDILPTIQSNHRQRRDSPPHGGRPRVAAGGSPRLAKPPQNESPPGIRHPRSQSTIVRAGDTTTNAGCDNRVPDQWHGRSINHPMESPARRNLRNQS